MGQIKVEKNVGGIEGLCVIEPAVHGDARGYFMETYNEKDMKEAGIDIHFVQDNQSIGCLVNKNGIHNVLSFRGWHSEWNGFYRLNIRFFSRSCSRYLK